jgi:DNA-binding GntR family transcriptional regulator
MDQREFTTASPSMHGHDARAAATQRIQPPDPEQIYVALRQELLRFSIRDRRDLSLTPLSIRFDASRTTITHALDRLVEDGLLRREHRYGYAPLETSAAEIEAMFVAIGSLLKEIYPRAKADNRRASRCDWDRAERQQRAAIVAKSQDAELVAAELELLLRHAASRSAEHAPQIETCLVALSRVRRVEGGLFANHPREVARLMRSFYAGQYDQFIEGLDQYTKRRAAAATQLRQEVYFKAAS